jgi:5-hydroxyisourate hydrolase-like protein (transthyretin family)
MSFMFPRYAGILVEKTMRTAKRFVLLTLVVFVAVSTGYSTMRVVQKEISTSRVLAGHVLVQGTDEPADGVTVELCSSDCKTVLMSTKTDEKGHFSLEQPATGKLFHVRVSAPGMDIYELRVRLRKQSTQEMTIRLSVAT